MFPQTVNTPKTSSLLSSSSNKFSFKFLINGLPLPSSYNNNTLLQFSKPTTKFCFVISATNRNNPSNPSLSSPHQQQQQQQQVYQPFRPPPSSVPSKFSSLDTNGRIEILANRLGIWFEYAPLIPSLIQEGFTSPTIEELTGITGVDQNRLVVAARVRETLIDTNIDPQTLAFFDSGGSELLYEIRLLSTTQRAAAAQFLVQNNFDARGAQDLARAIKDFPRRRGDRGWKSFDYSLPGDCLAYLYYRQALEHKNPSDQRTVWLNQALEIATSDAAKKQIMKDLEEKDGDGKEKTEGYDAGVRVPVVRMQVGEVAEATSVVVLPVCRAGRDKVDDAPWESKGEGEFGIVTAEKGWTSWVVLPGWTPVAGLKRGGVAVAFPDARVLPWKANKWYREEAILVVADRSRKEVVADDTFYMVATTEGGLNVERGSALKEMRVKESLGTVVLVIRPPTEGTEEQMTDEDWE